MRVSRRTFLGASATAVIAAGMKSNRGVFGANDRIQLCCIGIRNQGKFHIEQFLRENDAEIVALCDVDRHVLEDRAKELEQKTGNKPKTLVDIRDVMADNEIDAVSIATPNHWHTLAAIWACQAGKDVYVEKPLSHSVWEGRQLVTAAEKYGRIVQHGTQRRSEKIWLRDIALLHEGIIGDVYAARSLCSRKRNSIGFKDDCPPPPHIDWGLWQGPAKERIYNPAYVHYNWHWFWEYGNGEIGNQGVHQMDVAAWGLSKGLPVSIHSVGGRFVWKDQGETPNTQVSTFLYADGTMLTFEVRDLASYKEAGQFHFGNTFFGSQGYYIEGKGFFDANHRKIRVFADAPDTRGPYGNFLAAVRSRNPEEVHGTALDGHIASAHCHLANIAYRLGRSIKFDPDTETCPGDRKANAMLKRNYRKGFEVPALA
ncbi:MAG TPA: Gfo/Idh/MocA family oxidoreductase [Candidatus Hydrogenedentes bacterium]|nr:Gfo/Idh/MocA family oxidoreductase [Candidatus Hydrogenedentota bacterium]HIJ73537.1 Gfo/Idh/MocA family oxidoreductase [Candidatus Hydrogenedentota bacterium]